jgi:hypothetical protein
VLATYRDDEIDRAHPCGSCSASCRVARRLASRWRRCRRSRRGARRIHRGRPRQLHRRTAGNPFFRPKAAADADIPATVRDAVLACRAADEALGRCSTRSRSPLPPRWLLAALVDGELDDLDACVASGMPGAERDAVSFRHEIARVAVEDALPPHRRMALHRTARGARRARGAPGPGPPRASRGRRRRRGAAARAAGERAAMLVPSRRSRSSPALRYGGPAARAPRRAAGAPVLQCYSPTTYGVIDAAARARRTQRGRRSPARGRRTGGCRGFCGSAARTPRRSQARRAGAARAATARQ